MSSASKKRKVAPASDTTISTHKANPSTVLRALSVSTPPDTFIKLLEKQIYPVRLDSLPAAQKSTLLDALSHVEQARQSQEKLASIGYETHKRSLDNGVKDLLKHVKREWHDGYEEQSEMMQEISQEVLEWLPKLWQVGIEEGLEIQLIRKCLVLCTDIINKVANCGSRLEFSDMDSALTITNSKNATIYKEEYAGVKHSLAWMWRELLLKASTTPGAATKAIEADITRLKLKDKVYDLIRTKGGKQSSV